MIVSVRLTGAAMLVVPIRVSAINIKKMYPLLGNKSMLVSYRCKNRSSADNLFTLYPFSGTAENCSNILTKMGGLLSNPELL
jgi:hypothetical protein